MPFVPQLALLKKTTRHHDYPLSHYNFISFYVSCKVFQNKSVLFFMNLSCMDRHFIAGNFSLVGIVWHKYCCLYTFAQLYE